MSTSFDSIKRGLLKAIEHAEGRAPATRLHNSQQFASVWDAIEDTPEDAAIMKARSVERMQSSVDGTQNSIPAKWSREKFAKNLERDNQTAPPGTSVVEQMRDEDRY